MKVLHHPKLMRKVTKYHKKTLLNWYSALLF